VQLLPFSYRFKAFSANQQMSAFPSPPDSPLLPIFIVSLPSFPLSAAFTLTRL
jgi:hypothetical protein